VKYLFCIVMSGQHNDGNIIAFTLQLPGDLETIFHRQIDIQDDDVRMKLARRLQALFTIRALANYSDVRLSFKYSLQAIAEHRMVIHDQN
jgi:hypothetical protein